MSVKAPRLRAIKPSDIKPKKAKCVISGAAGVGKTTFACQFPAVHLIDVEGGATNPQYVKMLSEVGATYLGQDQGSLDFGTVIDEVQALAMTEHDRRTLVIDSFSKLFAQAVAEEEERLATVKKEMAFGNQRIPAIRLSRRLITWLSKLDMNVILICHEKALWQNGEQVGWTFDAWDKLSYELDLTMRLVKQGSSRRFLVTKSRLSAFPDGDHFDATYDAFAQRYGREQIEATPVVLQPATDEQVSQLTHLLDIVKLPEETLVSWKEKAAVTTWAEMDSDTIQACIQFLETKIRKG